MRRISHKLIASVIVLILLVAADSRRALSQNAVTTLSGNVVDVTGALVPHATITLTAVSSNQTFQTFTDDVGHYNLRNLVPGRYIFRATFEGFAVVTKTIDINVSAEATVNITMSPGNSETVQVSAQTISDPVWNVWAERSSHLTYAPQPMQLGLDYSIALNLAAFAYKTKDGKGVYYQDASASFVDWIKRNSSIDSADVQVLALPDPRFFQMEGNRLQTIPIDLKKIRELQKSNLALTQFPFDYLHSHEGNAPFSFGVGTFGFMCQRMLLQGGGSIAFSIWENGKPIDEVVVSLCVLNSPNDPCPDENAPTPSLRGVDLSGENTLPNGALHLIERGTDIVGVFRCNSCASPRYYSWTVGEQGPGWLGGQVRQLTDQLTPPVADRNSFGRVGDTLYNLIFPNLHDPDEKVAEDTFSAFASSMKAKLSNGAPGSLFVRVLTVAPDLVIFPTALLRVAIARWKKGFLGFLLNIESPLELQDYSTPQKCISKWTLFVPPDNMSGDIADARSYANDLIKALTSNVMTAPLPILVNSPIGCSKKMGAKAPRQRTTMNRFWF